MPPPRASKNFQQRQPITTTLRNICASYPTDTCLRELLQNADDAGATEIEYVLDTKSYTDKPLLHSELREYHGPAILARNNSVFKDEDFSSLSSVGDSGKRDDPASTGKFGQGFNSVSRSAPLQREL
jgi:sacsin